VQNFSGMPVIGWTSTAKINSAPQGNYNSTSVNGNLAAISKILSNIFKIF
jgi:hypothetical protein